MKSAWAEGKPSKIKQSSQESFSTLPESLLLSCHFTFHISVVVYSSQRTFQMGDTKKNMSQFNILVIRREMGHMWKNGPHLKK